MVTFPVLFAHVCIFSVNKRSWKLKRRKQKSTQETDTRSADKGIKLKGGET